MNRTTYDVWCLSDFLRDREHTYGMSEEMIREGLETISRNDEVRVMPGIPLLVPIFFGTLIAVGYGSLTMTVLLLFVG